mmetsp:Transcript_36461/g.91747  ORF Transcript_36461/g.91747 Transcript_36461/m.91747 type:complete len:275 (+) Transcript_36461:821-1645(+)
MRLIQLHKRPPTESCGVLLKNLCHVVCLMGNSEAEDALADKVQNDVLAHPMLPLQDGSDTCLDLRELDLLREPRQHKVEPSLVTRGDDGPDVIDDGLHQQGNFVVWYWSEPLCTKTRPDVEGITWSGHSAGRVAHDPAEGPHLWVLEPLGDEQLGHNACGFFVLFRSLVSGVLCKVEVAEHGGEVTLQALLQLPVVLDVGKALAAKLHDLEAPLLEPLLDGRVREEGVKDVGVESCSVFLAVITVQVPARREAVLLASVLREEIEKRCLAPRVE